MQVLSCVNLLKLCIQFEFTNVCAHNIAIMRETKNCNTHNPNLWCIDTQHLPLSVLAIY